MGSERLRGPVGDTTTVALNRTGFPGDSISWEIMEYGKTDDVFAGGAGACCPVGVGASGGAPLGVGGDLFGIAEKFGCSSETLRKWVRRAETDQGLRPGLTSPERERLKALERENRELRRANEILRKASAYFAQAELDRGARR